MGKIPIRSDVLIMGADTPSSSVGFMVYETDGMCIINPSCLKAGKSKNDPSKLPKIITIIG